MVLGEQDLFDLGWYLFEFAALTIPICPVHEEGDCDPEMEEQLKQYAPGEKTESIFRYQHCCFGRPPSVRFGSSWHGQTCSAVWTRI